MKREEEYVESFEALKKVLPAAIHPMLEVSNNWLIAQYEKIEDEMLEMIKKRAVRKAD